MKFDIITQNDKEGKHFAIWDPEINKTVIELVLRNNLGGTLEYEVTSKNKKIKMIIPNTDQLSAKLDKIGDINILYIIDTNKENPIPIYFTDEGALILPPINSGVLVGENNGNYLFVAKDKNNNDIRLSYSTKDKVTKIKDFAVVNAEGKATQGHTFIEENDIVKLDIANVNNEIKIYSVNKNKESCVYDLGLHLLLRRDLQNEKI